MRLVHLVLLVGLWGAIAPPVGAQETPTATETPNATETPAEATPTDPPTETPTETSPTPTLIGQCRLTNRTLSVYTKATVAAESDITTTIAPQTRVTLASEGAGGWIKISEPARGFIISRHLTTCPPETTTESEAETEAETDTDTADNNASRGIPFTQHATLVNLVSGACRQAIVDLAIRPQARSEARPFIGSVKEGATMTLTGQSQMGAEHRLWLQIAKPHSGWVSGGVEGGTNVAFCEE